MWSKYLVPKPKDWEAHVEVVGFFLDKSALPISRAESAINPWSQKLLDEQLPEIVKNFLLSGPPPIFVGFGSMVVENPITLIQVHFIWFDFTGLGLYRSRRCPRDPNNFPIRLD